MEISGFTGRLKGNRVKQPRSKINTQMENKTDLGLIIQKTGGSEAPKMSFAAKLSLRGRKGH